MDALSSGRALKLFRVADPHRALSFLLNTAVNHSKQTADAMDVLSSGRALELY